MVTPKHLLYSISLLPLPRQLGQLPHSLCALLGSYCLEAYFFVMLDTLCQKEQEVLPRMGYIMDQRYILCLLSSFTKAEKTSTTVLSRPASMHRTSARQRLRYAKWP